MRAAQGAWTPATCTALPGTSPRWAQWAGVGLLLGTPRDSACPPGPATAPGDPSQLWCLPSWPPGPGLQAPVSASPAGRASVPYDEPEQGRCCKHDRAQEWGWPRPCSASPGRRRRKQSCARGSGWRWGVGGQGGRSEADGDGRRPLPAPVLLGLVSAVPPPCHATQGQDEALSTTFGRRPHNPRLVWPVVGTLSTGSPPTRPRWGQASIVSAVWLFLSVLALGRQCGPSRLRGLGPAAPALRPGAHTWTTTGLPNAPRGRQPPGSVANDGTGGTSGGSLPPQQPPCFSHEAQPRSSPGLLGHRQHPILVVLLQSTG